MKGRHTPAARGAQDEDAPGEYDSSVEEEPRTGRRRKLALYLGLALCVVFTAWVVWGFIQFDHAIENPEEGGFSGWQCDAGRSC